ncbi:CpaF family protein [Paraburkholderia tropica]|uniref:CpaF family protein n=1 Tax=Paraburkholderia tropica TaxID=92647 RepID=UPI002AB76039|nr:ATPase, T2SS/T4P/T4SS family [Paraburkholderia tropica]
MNKLSTAYALGILRDHLAPIGPFLDDPDVQEIMINRPDSIYVEKRGDMHLQEGLSLSDDAIAAALNVLGNVNDRHSAQVIDARMPGLRIAAARTPTAMHGNSMCIRKHATHRIDMADYVRTGAFDALPPDAAQMQFDREVERMLAHMRHGGQVIADFFQWVSEARLNIVLSGATSSGKTTLLNALIELIAEEDRLITIEDTGELQVRVPNFVSFETNPALGVGVRDLVRLSLRYRPTRIVVGEIRGAEAFDLMDALNTGHPGSAVSFHADSSDMAPARLESMIRMAPEAQNWPLADLRRQVASTFRFIVHAQKVGGRRGPQEIRQILGAKDGVYQTRLLYSKVKREDHHYALPA